MYREAPLVTDTYHRLRRERKKLVAQRLIERAERKEEGVVINKFLLGCDPEFVALDSVGRIINGEQLGNGEIGYDHSGRVLELRPEPSKGAYALVKKIRRLLKDAKLQRLGAAKFRAGARVAEQSLGGHVHFGIDPPDMYSQDPNTRSLNGVIPALDTVTRLLEHLDILPKNESSLRRHGNYGKFSDFRTSHGRDGIPHVEYRTMASWLHDPKVAFLCLTAAKLAAADPNGTLGTLKGATSYSKLLDWIGAYRSKDTNAKRCYEKLPEHRMVSVDPDGDLRTRWEELGL